MRETKRALLIAVRTQRRKYPQAGTGLLCEVCERPVVSAVDRVLVTEHQSSQRPGGAVLAIDPACFHVQ